MGLPVRNMGPTPEEYRSTREEYGYTPEEYRKKLKLQPPKIPYLFSTLPLKKSSVLIIYPSRIPWFLNRGGEWVRVLHAIAPCGCWGQHNMTAAHKTMFSSYMALRPTVLDKIDGKFVPPPPPPQSRMGNWRVLAFALFHP